MKILLTITFVYGPLNLLCRLLRKSCISLPFKSLGLGENKNGTVIGGLLVLIDLGVFYFSIFFQAYYWLFK